MVVGEGVYYMRTRQERHRQREGSKERERGGGVLRQDASTTSQSALNRGTSGFATRLDLAQTARVGGGQPQDNRQWGVGLFELASYRAAQVQAAPTTTTSCPAAIHTHSLNPYAHTHVSSHTCG